MDENFDQKRSAYFGDVILKMLGLLVVVPDNPETNFFQIIEGILGLLKKHELGPQHHLLKVRIFSSIIAYLAAQL